MTSMQTQLTPDDVFSQILMQRTVDRRTVLLLEGIDDCAALDVHVDERACVTISANGKLGVVAVVKYARGNNVSRVLGIVDNDGTLTSVGGSASGAGTATDLIETYNYDLDAEIFMTRSVVSRVGSLLLNRNGNGTTAAKVPTDLRSICLELAKPISMLRLLSHRDGWGLNMAKFPIAEVIKFGPSAHVSVVDAVAIAIRRSHEVAVSQEEIREVLSKHLTTTPQLERMCCGHDLASALAAYAQSRLGSREGQKQVEKYLRVALSCQDLIATSLYARVESWSEARSTTVWNCKEP